jgi:membrane protease YdiL (CAAX protease family)
MAETQPPTAARRIPLAYLPLPFVLQLVAQVLVLAPLARGGIERGQLFYTPAAPISVIAAYVVLIATSVWVARRAGPAREVLGLRPVPLLKSAGLVLAALIATSIAAQLLEPVFHGVRSQGLTPDPFPGGARATLSVIGMTFATALLGPLGEEIYFRGLLCGRLLAYGRVAGVLGSGLLFAGAHLEADAFPVLALIGIALGTLYVVTGSLYPGVAFHVLNNAAALAVAFA